MRSGWCTGLALALAACGGRARPVEFRGHAAQPIVAPEAVIEASAILRGAERLGRLSVRCRPLSAAGSFHERSLLDVDCSVERLRRLLREAASELGGDVLAELSCQQGSNIACRAILARRRAQLAPQPSARPDASPDVRGELGAHVFVSYEARGARAERSVRAEDNVREHSVLAPAQVALGNLETTCKDCSELSARDALRIAAGRLGASDLVSVRCVSQGEGQRCLAEAAVWEGDAAP